MNFGIEGLHMYIIEHYHLQAKLLTVFHKFKQNMKGSTKDVWKERIQRRHFHVARANQKESWKSSTLMYADQCHQVHKEGMYTMFLSLITFLGRHGFTSWRTKVKYSTSWSNSKPWSRITLKRRSILFDQIMVENSHQMNSNIYAKNQGLKREISTPYNPQ